MTGPGTRSDRLGTWGLIFFLLLLLPFLFVPITPLALWALALACGGATLGAIACGFVGLFSQAPDERRAALQGLLKAAVPIVVGGFFGLLWLQTAFNHSGLE
jgi:uncharacterized SAM-binding protein YcdF (DUF218 family)